MKPYQKIPIEDCGEPLIPIPLELFVIETPHPYEKLGANYQGKSPYYLRQGVVEALIKAQHNLQQKKPNWYLKIFDAFRPLSVQQFMVDYTFDQVIQNRQLDRETLSSTQLKDLWEQVYTLWAIPSDDPKTPPPHSTGAAVDITLINEQGETVEMGGEIDELSKRSQPNYYLYSTDLREQEYHQNRSLLNEIMIGAGFRRHLGEWWHFSLGDQMWVWLGLLESHSDDNPKTKVAYYGRI